MFGCIYKYKKSGTVFTDTLEWPECNLDQATVGSVVCTVYTSGQPCKPCGLFEIGSTLTYSSFLDIVAFNFEIES